jgi:regulatory protein
MATISALEPQKKNPQRVNVYLDGDFAFALGRITAAWLQVGQELSEQKASELQEQDRIESTYQRALHFLSFRPRSIQEVAQNLHQHGLDQGLIDQTIARLRLAGLVDDEDFARTWIENRSTFRPRSQSALRFELRRKGLSEETIQSALEAGADDARLALLAARKQAHRYAGLEWSVFRQKLGSFLARRGFSYGTLTPVISEVWNEMQTADAGSFEENED